MFASILTNSGFWILHFYTWYWALYFIKDKFLNIFTNAMEHTMVTVYSDVSLDGPLGDNLNSNVNISSVIFYNDIICTHQ